jgi:threonine dehydrogenase-like Zn-dependent dehydrogenase
VTAISRRQFALDVAAAQGAADLVTLDDVPAAIGRAQAVASPDGYHAVIEAAGTQAALDVASALVGVRGRLVIAGYHQDGPRQVDMQSWNWRGLDVINAHERDPRVYVDGMRTALALADSGEWDPSALITHTLPLDELDRALTLLSTRPDGFLKAVVVP